MNLVTTAPPHLAAPLSTARGCEDLQWLTLEALEHAFNLEKDLKECGMASHLMETWAVD